MGSILVGFRVHYIIDRFDESFSKQAAQQHLKSIFQSAQMCIA